jgi:hypothetical protein
MFGIFGPKCPLSRDEWDFQLAAFQWLDETVGAGVPRQPLVTPTPDYFPPSAATGAARAAELLAQVQRAAAMDAADWPVTLEMQSGIGDPHVPVAHGINLVHDTPAPAGSFRVDAADDEAWQAVISLSPAQLADEMSAIATLAHELSHYLLASFTRPLPGGEDCHELLTDLTAVYLGFGIFMGNSAGSTAPFADEYGQWGSAYGQGYLSERALMTALAIQERLAGRDPLAAAPWLKPHLAQDLRAAAKYIASRDLAAEMAAIDLAEYGAAA